MVPRKLREWGQRYLPAEIAGTLAALAAAWTVHALTGSLVSAAIAGAIGESLGYYGCIAVREALQHGSGQRRRGIRTARDMLIEFGPAEAVDSLLVRPFLMFLMPSLLHNFTVGITAGKLAADVVFYTLAISSYELTKQYLPSPGTEER